MQKVLGRCVKCETPSDEHVNLAQSRFGVLLRLL